MTHDSCTHTHSEVFPISPSESQEDPEWYFSSKKLVSDTVKTYDGLGCFPFGVHVSVSDFQGIVFSQRNLRKLALLNVMDPKELQQYGFIFSKFLREINFWQESTALGSPCDSGPVEELARTLQQSLDYGMDKVRVYSGLNSGFQLSSKTQFWAVYEVHESGSIDIYISKNVRDVPGSILHTFLSSRGYTRHQCFAAEVIFARWQKSTPPTSNIPPRVEQDLEGLTPGECMRLLQRVSFALNEEHDSILEGVKAGLLDRLLVVPTLAQLKTINTVAYLDERITVEELIHSRLEWHCHCGRSHPSFATAVAMFQEIETKICKALIYRNRRDLDNMVSDLEQLLVRTTTETFGDLFALAIFCTARKVAFEEVYIEVTDRNPLFNDQPDQAAAFAELFALGSRCEAYFDVSPSQFGKLLSNKFRKHYGNDINQPPGYKETQQALNSAYAEAQIDVDPDYQPHKMPQYQHFTFLSVFAIPALIDILMLTTTGHGLYLSGTGFMSLEEQHSATVALMVSLVLSGAIGTWITCGGTYYLASMAFSAMNYFVVTRLLGGFAFTIVAALVGFIAFTCTTSTHAAIVFFFYFIVLTSYLSLLAALANYQSIGSAFLSVSGSEN